MTQNPDGLNYHGQFYYPKPKPAERMYTEAEVRKAFEAGMQIVNHELAFWGDFIHNTKEEFIEAEFKNYKAENP